MGSHIRSSRKSVYDTSRPTFNCIASCRTRECPKCLHVGKMVKYEALGGNIVECIECGEEFDEADFKSIKDPSAILSLKEKQGFLRPFLNE